MNFKKRYIVIVILLISVAIGSGFLLSENEKKSNKNKDQLTLDLAIQKKEMTKGVEVTLYIDIKNNNLKTYKKTYDSPCKELWEVEWKKDGKPFENKIRDCKNTKEKSVSFKPSQSERIILKKELIEPGKYEVIVNVFGQKKSSKFIIGKQEDKKK